MDFSVALTLVQTLLQLLDSSSPLGREIESLWGYKSQLKKLENTMSIIQAVLLEAERRQRQHIELPLPLLNSLKRLNEVLYDADDLFDEIATLIQRKQLMSGNSVSKEVSLFFSRYNQIINAFTTSSEIKKVRKTLDEIARDHSQFGALMPQQSGGQSSQIGSNSRETSSLLCEKDVIIGRDDDKRVLIDMLLHTAVEESVSCVSIVGIGGLGKTTLAQLVYNDKMIDKEFKLKIWICVSNDFDVKALLAKILAVATKMAIEPRQTMDQLHTNIRQVLDGKKYLLVLDDVWSDVTSKWRELRKPLIGGGSRGSRILLTTRSANIAEIVDGQTHELKGLSEADSWNLFERMTLKSRHEMEALNGKKILKKCASVPLAIRVIGSLLQGQGKNKWMDMGNTDLASKSNEDIMPVLKISYYDLPLHLKRCFSYCAIFPKDYVIIKEDLISLWMAQGFIKANGQSLENVGEEYFTNLLERCFFQDVKRGDDDEIIACKMHDLIHDVAKNIVGSEMMLVQSSQDNLKAQVCHVYIENEEGAIRFCTRMKRMRTLLISQHCYVHNVEISKVINLRVLSCPNTLLKKVPNMMGELLHLRYLDLSDNDFRFLSPSITNLFNLQTLKLRSCTNLEILPKDLKKLIKLRCLDLDNCRSLNNMPPGMRSMTCIYKLTRFVLGKNERNNANFLGADGSSGLEDLKCLKLLTGTLQIRIKGDWTYDAAEVREGGYLSEMEQLKGIMIEFDDTEGNNNNNAEALLEGLQPNHNLRMFDLSYYPGVRFPSWGMRGVLSKNLKYCLPNLVELCLYGCSRLKHLPLMRQLPKLRVVRLMKLSNLEYVESNSNGDELGGSADEFMFFSSLEILELKELPMLNGWDLHSNSHEFPQLNKLTIQHCDELTTFPICPKAGSFHNTVTKLYCEHLSFYKSSSSGVYDKRVEINRANKRYIIYSLPKEILHQCPHLVMQSYIDIEDLITLTGEVIKTGRMPSLISLVFYCCNELSRLSEFSEMWGSKHLTALETLRLEELPELELEWEEEGENSSRSNRECKTAFDTPWRSLAPTLRTLTLRGLPKLVKLPRGMQRLTSLHALEILKCHNLEELPAWMDCCTSLKSLRIFYCKNFKSLKPDMCRVTFLHLEDLPKLELEREDDDKNSNSSSRECKTGEEDEKCSLILQCLPKLVKLPRGMQRFTSLHSLRISQCYNFEELPAWIGCFTSLQSLQIDYCIKLKSIPQEMCHLTSLQDLVLSYNSEELKKRCQKPSGADWPKIQHIPKIQINYRRHSLS